MKLSLITMQGVYNYGSALQTYASQTIFEKYGYDVEVLNYYPERMRSYGTMPQLYRDAMHFHNNQLKCMIIAFVKFWSIKTLKKAFVPFSEKYIKKTKVYESNEDLRNSPPKADVYCTGSDQVWNDFLEGHFDPAYFLDFAPAEKRKIAFSASFGRDDIEPEELAPVKSLLEKYSAISVREETGLTTLRDVNVPLKQVVLDPTFLLRGDEWRQFAKPVSRKGYIVVYKLHEDSIASEVALAIGKKENKPVIRVSLDFFKRIRGGETIVAPEVQEFISYIANADLVVTDSFHATAFSVNLNVPFVSVKWRMFNDRIGTILSKTGLEERSVSSIEQAMKIYDKKIDFESANIALEKERSKTEEFLTKALQLKMPGEVE